MFLQMRQLSECLGTNRALERSFPVMSAKVNLQIGKLSEYFLARFAFVFDLSVFLLQRIRKRFVTAGSLILVHHRLDFGLYFGGRRRGVGLPRRGRRREQLGERRRKG